jgi:hypothetical protein
MYDVYPGVLRCVCMCMICFCSIELLGHLIKNALNAIHSRAFSKKYALTATWLSGHLIKRALNSI